MRALPAALVVSLAAVAPVWADQPPPFDPVRHVDVEVAAWATQPERFSVCVAGHPGRRLEVDVCFGEDQGLQALSTHVFYRGRWVVPSGAGAASGLLLGLGPALGARGMRFCPYSQCALSAGPEALLSLEAVWWFEGQFGLALQLDGGLAWVWTSSASGVVDSSLWFPVRLSLGLAF